MNIDKSKKDYAICSSKLDQRCFIPWSSPEDNFSFKHRYVPCSRSVPYKNKRFVKYRLSRSLNFDSSNSSLENSSLEEDKHLSRSAKIMRALNFNSPSYYGKTKIKKSLNFNLTPSPKRFRHVKRGIQKSLSLNSSPLSVSNKFINLDDNHSESTNSSLLFSSSDSIDENQNETPLQQNTKEHEMLHYSTPNTKNIRKSLGSASFTPLLRSRMKETIDNIVYITATPSSQSLKCIKESMSAIKKSHKKERSSRRSACYSTQFIDNESVPLDRSRFLANQHRKYIDSFEDTKSDIDRCTDENSNSNELILNHSEDNISETGSLFDYTEEQKNILEESKEVSSSVVHEIDKFDVKIKLEENVDRLSKIDPSNINANNSTNNTRSVTPVPVKEDLNSQKSVTPENRINILETIIKDSIKKSHKKIKGDNKKRLFSPKVLQDKLKATEEQENIKCSQNFVQYENIELNKVPTKVNNLDVSREERSCTPEKVNSSRLLLSQYSSVKKSHKKDKHNKIISGFLKRQEYFNKDIDLVTNNEYKAFNNDMTKCKNSMENYSDLDIATNIDDSTSLVASASLNSSLEKLSPSKRRKPQGISSDSEKNILYDSELQELDTSKEEFQIFTPLKRKRSLIVSIAAKEYTHFDDSSIEHSKDVIPNISFSRCLTPVLNLSSSCKRAEKCNTLIKSDDVNNETAEEIYDCGSNDVTGRLTPRNMSTTELYSNLDSIKKSHKKNKRGSSSWKSIGLIEGNHSVDGKCEISVENVLNETNNLLELSNNCAVIDDVINKSICNKSIEKLANPITDNQNCASISTENVSPFATPPNCLKTKSYIKLLQQTSIKRSHRKIRNKKKEELIIDTDELSDDGSIFGDEEKLSFAEDKSTHD
ncbi:uncharacterized protein LOC122538082 isoform X2 [Frieseomelitta varia]|uniref:uncharacterized protein LOC122538082 isoform X2 n=1 Tax=Frieseomelitta varia TaxID=561572 RepID=UPI001CB69D34|nr:uncharacterized protein LOC122538082 isoform X2 [Frieseomelitta varia]